MCTQHLLVSTLGKLCRCALLQEILPAVEPNLSHPSQAMRCATLRLLCCFEQPAMLQTGTAKPSSTAQSSQIFPMCLSIQSQTCTVDSGRQAAVTIGKMRTYLEYGQVPAEQVGPLVRCLIGILHIRFSLLWPPCIEALAAALDHSSHHSWPLVLQQLTTAQNSFLSGAASGGGGGSRFPEAQDSAEVPQLSAELSKAMHGGEVEQSGGCTDAAMRLGNMLKVRQP
jgi:U3 small nucleolar RNA-associated protein 20